MVPPVGGTKNQRFRSLYGVSRVYDSLGVEGVVARFPVETDGDHVVDPRLDNASYTEGPNIVRKETVVVEFYQIPGGVIQSAKGIELAERVDPQVGRSGGVGQVDFEDVTVVARINTSVYRGTQLHRCGSVIVVSVVVYDGLSPSSTGTEDKEEAIDTVRMSVLKADTIEDA